MDERTQSGENSLARAIFEDDDDDKTSLMVDTTLELGVKEDLPKFQEIDDEDLENPMDRLALVILVGCTVFICLFGLFYLLVLLICGVKF